MRLVSYPMAIVASWLLFTGCISESTPQSSTSPPTQSANSSEDSTLKPGPSLGAPIDQAPLGDKSQEFVAAALSLAIELEQADGVPLVDFDEWFRVTLTNNTNHPVRIWSTNSKQGYRQLSFRFRTSPSAEPEVVSRTDIENEIYW